MATTFFIRTKKKEGFAPICVRVQSSVLKINIRQSTGLVVPVARWNKVLKHKNVRCSSEEVELFRKLEDIRLTVNGMIAGGAVVTPEVVRKIVYKTVYGNIMNSGVGTTLGDYINLYVTRAEQGLMKTRRGVRFSEGTIKSIRMVKRQFEGFQKKGGKTYDFDDVDLEFRTEFMNYLYEDRKYNINTAAKCINTLITMLSSAYIEGYHTNLRCLSRHFKAIRQNVDSVYLTKEELKDIMTVDLSKMTRIHELVRDVFMIGVYTAQRVSDYNNISRDDIVCLPDGRLVIRICQKKTGVWVNVPVKDELKGILEKYGYNVPRVSEQSINLCIKEIAKSAGIDQMVSFVTTVGGIRRVETRPKYTMIHSHTARRTGATLMYLAGMDMFNICSVTGHSSIKMLKKYIRADELEKANVVFSDAAFFKW